MSAGSAPEKGIQVRRFERGDLEAIARLNARFAAAAIGYVVYSEGHEQHSSGSIPERLFVATGGGEIRGAVWLKEQPFRVNGNDVVMGWPKYLISESLIDARYIGVPGKLLRACLNEQPLLMGLGFGGHRSPMARLLAAHKWTGETVPFLFRAVKPGRVIRELEPARRSRTRRLAAMLAHRTGAAFVGWHAFAAIRAPRQSPVKGLLVDAVTDFGTWADEVWARCADSLGLVMVRDARMLNALYPTTMPDVTRLRVRRDGADIGWAVVVAHNFDSAKPDRVFGALSVGMVADVLAQPENARAVGRVAVDWLAEAGADVIISNQSHPAWITALRRAGLVDGPVNFALYRSPAVMTLLASRGVEHAPLHINRGDADGPVWWGEP